MTAFNQNCPKKKSQERARGQPTGGEAMSKTVWGPVQEDTTEAGPETAHGKFHNASKKSRRKLPEKAKEPRRGNVFKREFEAWGSKKEDYGGGNESPG